MADGAPRQQATGPAAALRASPSDVSVCLAADRDTRRNSLALQIQIYLEASDIPLSAYWIVAAEIADMPALRRSLACVTPSRASSLRQSSPAAAAHHGIAPLPGQRAIPFDR